MDPRLLEYYNRELQFMRETGAEFARQYPRVAARLGLDGLECADPYVERLLEGFAFLAARVQLKLDARHPQFTQQLLDLVYPGFLAPVPAAAIVEMMPDLEEGSLKEGVKIPRGSSIRTPLAKGERTSCEFRTSQDVTLWPLTVSDAKYLSGTGAVSGQGLTIDAHTKAAIRLRLTSAMSIPIETLPLDSLTFHIKATPGVASRIYEQIHANCIGLRVRPVGTQQPDTALPASCVREVGFDDSAAMLPVTRAGFAGFRLLQEYFILPERFMFVELRGLRDALRSCAASEFEITLLLDRVAPTLEHALDAGQFRLNCTPAINLFPKSCGRIDLTGRDVEYHILPDRNRPQDFEVYTVEKVTGIAREGGGGNFPIAPFYAAAHRSAANEERAYYTVQRRPRLASVRQTRTGERTSYLGTECFISVTDSAQRIERGEAPQADIEALCTNRDLPIHATFGKGRSDFVLESGAPVAGIRCITGPTSPRAAPTWGESAWRLVSHLSLNYLSIEAQGVELLRDFLALYADQHDSVSARQIEGLQAVSVEPVVRRMPVPGPISHGRGLAITLTLDDAAFEGIGVLPLAAALERFFSRYVSLNSFTQLRLRSSTRGDIKQWPVRIGSRHVL
ncbi:MAG TPA: type VI secretion system baseplate subunit TssF [Steroidobacteraceae bacterium]|nr:type VI secretion system baseplate subunit TssF [Steroidobacteraceae bacterium]